MTDPNPDGLCQCGCGARTSVIRTTAQAVASHSESPVRRGRGNGLHSLHGLED
jgi:hypothetical protein